MSSAKSQFSDLLPGLSDLMKKDDGFDLLAAFLAQKSADRVSSATSSYYRTRSARQRGTGKFAIPRRRRSVSGTDGDGDDDDDIPIADDDAYAMDDPVLRGAVFTAASAAN